MGFDRKYGGFQIAAHTLVTHVGGGHTATATKLWQIVWLYLLLLKQKNVKYYISSYVEREIKNLLPSFLQRLILWGKICLLLV